MFIAAVTKFRRWCLSVAKINLVNILPTHFFEIYFIASSHLRLRRSSKFFPSGFSNQNLVWFFPSTPCHVHLIILGLITLKILIKQYKLRSSSLRDFLQSYTAFCFFKSECSTEHGLVRFSHSALLPLCEKQRFIYLLTYSMEQSPS